MEEKEKFHTVRGYELLNQEKKSLTPAMEDYLEMIYRNSLKDGYVRINTLAELLNVAAPSVTNMVQKLSRIGLIDYKKYELIFLTDRGREIGSFLLQRHLAIEQFLRNIEAGDELLIETELIEHSIGDKTLSRIESFNKFFKNNPDIKKAYIDFLNDNKA
ncbi:MAG: iron dependent repressor, metal binding and dimerization domain protein [Bacillota bacterium]|nr:iron dependent repressor, metal binding and dimerization domain protein [Bacillota bacterium]